MGNEQNTNKYSIISMVLGIIAVVTSWIVVGVIPAIISIVFGIKSLKHNVKNKFVIIGLICSGAALIIGIIMASVFNKTNLKSNNNPSEAEQIENTIDMGDTEDTSEEVTEPLTEEESDPEVIETPTEQAPVEEEPTTVAPSEVKKTIIGNPSSMKYHTRNCGYLPDEDNRVYFDSVEDAIAAGYTKCGKCK